LAIAISLSIAIPYKASGAIILSRWSSSAERAKRAQQAQQQQQQPEALVEILAGPNGEPIVVFMAGVAEGDESRVLKTFGQMPNMDVHVLVNEPTQDGTQDPLLERIRGLKTRFKLWVADKFEDSQFFQGWISKSRDLKQKTLERARAVSTYVKEKRGSIMAGIFVGAINSGAVFLTSGSVSATMLSLPPIAAYATFVLAESDKWGAVLDASGRLHANFGDRIMSWWSKRKLSEDGRRNWENIGKLDLTMLQNAVQLSWVFSLAGLWHPDLASAAIQLVTFSYINSYNIWDPTFLRKLREGLFHERHKGRYFGGQLVLGPVAEVAAFLHLIPGMDLLLGSLTTSGFVYQFLKPEHEGKLASHYTRTKQAAINIHQRIPRPRWSTMSIPMWRKQEACDLALVGPYRHGFSPMVSADE